MKGSSVDNETCLEKAVPARDDEGASDYISKTDPAVVVIDTAKQQALLGEEHRALLDSTSEALHDDVTNDFVHSAKGILLFAFVFCAMLLLAVASPTTMQHYDQQQHDENEQEQKSTTTGSIENLNNAKLIICTIMLLVFVGVVGATLWKVYIEDPEHCWENYKDIGEFVASRIIMIALFFGGFALNAYFMITALSCHFPLGTQALLLLQVVMGIFTTVSSRLFRNPCCGLGFGIHHAGYFGAMFGVTGMILSTNSDKDWVKGLVAVTTIVLGGFVAIKLDEYLERTCVRRRSN